jgi:hypothetical protein
VAQTATLFDFDLQATGTVAAIAAATQDSIRLKGRAGGTASRTMDLVPAALGASRTVTFPDADGTVTYKELAQTWSATQTFAAITATTIGASGIVAITDTTDGTSTTAASLVTAGGMAWGSSKTTYGGLLNLAGLLTAGGQLQTTGALTAVGASKLTLDQSAASVSRIIAFGEDDSTAGTLQLVAASSAVGIYDVCLSLTSAGVTSDRAWTLSNGLTVSGGNLQLSSGTLLLATSTPASASATGVQGTITWDSSYIYVCTATDTWKRVAIATW